MRQHHLFVLHCMIDFFGTHEVSSHCIGTFLGFLPPGGRFEFDFSRGFTVICHTWSHLVTLDTPGHRWSHWSPTLACSRWPWFCARRTRWLPLRTPSGPPRARGCAPAHPAARTMTDRATSSPRFQLGNRDLIQSGASYQSQGFEDNVLGSSPRLIG